MVDEREGDVSKEELPFAFNRKPVLSRIAIVCAGPFFNIIFAIFAYWLMYVIGITTIAPIIGKITPDSIAYKAELAEGDEFITINGRSVNSWREVRHKLISRIGDEEPLSIQLKDTKTGLTKHRTMNLKDWRLNNSDGDPIEGLGIIPFRPKIPVIIAKVMPGGPAEKAGLLPDDKILAVDGEALEDWYQFVAIIKSKPNQSRRLLVERNQTRKNITVQNGEFLGVQSYPFKWPENFIRKERYSPLTALPAAFSDTWGVTVLTFSTLKKMVIGKVSLSSLTGPVGIAKGAGITASYGIAYFLGFLALISISLAVLNLLPIPVLDGGHLLYYIIEIVTRRPVSERVQAFFFKIGLALLLGLMILALYNDVVRIFD